MQVSTPTGMVAGVNSTVPLVVVDEPVWPYRAVMLDTGRHYLSIETIQKTIDGMAALKLNVLHWHILDSTSFPVQSLKFQQLSAKGAYSSLAVYSLVRPLFEPRSFIGLAPQPRHRHARVNTRARVGTCAHTHHLDRFYVCPLVPLAG
jgi:hypothetical protein